jgi:hypothetical protein
VAGRALRAARRQGQAGQQVQGARHPHAGRPRRRDGPDDHDGGRAGGGERPRGRALPVEAALARRGAGRRLRGARRRAPLVGLAARQDRGPLL